MRTNELIRLIEGIGDLYHLTSTSALYKIMSDNIFELTYAVNYANSRFHDGRRNWYMSLSRVPVNDYRRGSGGVTLVMDGDKLRHRHIIRPVEYWGTRGAVGLGRGTGSESEERLFSDKPTIRNARSFIKEIHVLKSRNFSEDPHLQFLIYTEIPTFIYDDQNSYELLNKRRSMSPSEAFKDVEFPNKYISNERSSIHFEDMLEFLEGGMKDRSSKWYRYLKWDKRDWKPQFLTEIHNFGSKKGGYARSLMKRLDALMRKFGARDVGEFADLVMKDFEERQGGK